MPAVQTISNVFLGLSAITILSGIVFAISKNDRAIKAIKKQNIKITTINPNSALVEDADCEEGSLPASTMQGIHIKLLIVGVIFLILGIALLINQ
ncbi:MAG: hypothetical protein C4545_01690 [Anaerolineaceae bacterium]|jgi:hypothetical protein|nr:MAG: hypothetical protein C4545_01690 [Anaerolineaceae bacterium]